MFDTVAHLLSSQRTQRLVSFSVTSKRSRNAILDVGHWGAEFLKEKGVALKDSFSFPLPLLIPAVCLRECFFFLSRLHFVLL